MAPQVYKVVTTPTYEISGYNIIARLLHAQATHLEGINGDFQSDLSKLKFNQGEQFEGFHSRILRLQK